MIQILCYDVAAEQVVEEVSETVWLAPTMKTKPKAQVIEEGQDVHFECTITGKPQPEVCSPLSYSA